LPKEAWIETVFKRYMHLPDEVVNVFLTALPGEVEQQEQHESRKKSPNTRQVIAEISQQMGKYPQLAESMRQLREIAHANRLPSAPPPQKWKASRIFNPAPIKENDVIISSLGRHPFELTGVKPLRESKDKKGVSIQGATMKALTENKKSPLWDNDGATAPATPKTEANGAPVQEWGPSRYRKYIHLGRG